MLNKQLLEPVNGEIIKLNGFYLKLENKNPSGSIKFRPALEMFNQIYKEYKLQKSDTIIETTSGNMGIALAYICNYYDINCIIVMPSKNKEKIERIKKYNAEVIITDEEKGLDFSRMYAEKLSREKGYYYINQFNNINNPKGYYKLADEIITEFEHIDYFICGMGTGGCINGVGKKLKEKYPDIKIIGIEPSESAFITNKEIKPHLISGIGLTMLGDFFDINLIDKLELVKGNDAVNKAKELYLLGYDIGISSAANILVCEKYINMYPDKVIVSIVHDGVDKYLSDLDV